MLRPFSLISGSSLSVFSAINSLTSLEVVSARMDFKGRGGKENQVISCFTNNLIKENGELRKDSTPLGQTL